MHMIEWIGDIHTSKWMEKRKKMKRRKKNPFEYPWTNQSGCIHLKCKYCHRIEIVRSFIRNSNIIIAWSVLGVCVYMCATTTFGTESNVNACNSSQFFFSFWLSLSPFFYSIQYFYFFCWTDFLFSFFLFRFGC